MNYIKRLEQELAEMKTLAEEARNEATSLRRYLTSDKFRSGNELDGYVNVKDVLTRLGPIIAPLS